MKTFRVRDAQVVVILTKGEAKFLLRGIQSGYFQATKRKARIVQELETALAETGAKSIAEKGIPRQQDSSEGC
jgi:hypothetical protein